MRHGNVSVQRFPWLSNALAMVAGPVLAGALLVSVQPQPLDVATTTAPAGYTDLPVVEVAGYCGGYAGYWQGWFRRRNSDGARAQYRGGFRTANNQWIVTGVSVYGVIGQPSGNHAIQGGTSANGPGRPGYSAYTFGVYGRTTSYASRANVWTLVYATCGGAKHGAWVQSN